MRFIDTISVINLISSLGYAPSKSRVNIKAEMDNIHLDNKNTANPCAAVNVNTPIDLCHRSLYSTFIWSCRHQKSQNGQTRTVRRAFISHYLFDAINAVNLYFTWYCRTLQLHVMNFSIWTRRYLSLTNTYEMPCNFIAACAIWFPFLESCTILDIITFIFFHNVSELFLIVKALQNIAWKPIGNIIHVMQLARIAFDAFTHIPFALESIYYYIFYIDSFHSACIKEKPS